MLPQARGPREWRSIGQVLATLRDVTSTGSGLGDQRGFFGPWPQDNRPVPTNQWTDFYLERRITPLLQAALASGHLPPDLAAGVDRIVITVDGRQPEGLAAMNRLARAIRAYG